MADRNQTKSERRQEAGHTTKAERKEAKLRRKQRAGSAAPPLETATPGDDASDAGIEERLARLEQAVVAQSQLSEELLEKLDEVLEEARKSARHAKTAAAGPGPGPGPEGETPQDQPTDSSASL
jgi:hypothetical protein